MEQVGRVVSVENEMAEVEIYRVSGCGGNCKSCGGCGESTAMTISVRNEIDAKVGQMVQVGSSTKGILLAAFITYGLPTILLIATCAIVYYSTLGKATALEPDLLGILSGLGVLVVYFIGLKLFDKRFAASKKFDVEINKIMS